MLARVKQDYAAGPVIAFSGREYVRSEWREVPAGFEEQAKTNPLLETQPSLDEIRAHGSQAPGLGIPPPAETAVTTVTEEAVPPAETPAQEPQADAQPEEPPADEPPADAAVSGSPAEEAPAEESEPKTSRRRRRAAEE